MTFARATLQNASGQALLRREVGLVWDDYYAIVLLVELYACGCVLESKLKFEPGSSVVVDLGSGHLALGTVSGVEPSRLTIGFSKPNKKGQTSQSIPRHVLLAAGVPHDAISLRQRRLFAIDNKPSLKGSTTLPTHIARCAVFGAILLSSVTYAETYGTVDFSTGVQHDSDPFLQGGEDTATGSARASIRPEIRFEDALFKIAVSGFLNYNEYFDRYDEDVSWGLNLTGSQEIDPLTAIDFSASALTTQRGSRNFGGDGLIVPDEGLPDATIPDLSELGSQTRTRQLNASLGLDRRMSETETLRLGAQVRDVSVLDRRESANPGRDGDYQSLSYVVGYERIISPRTTAVTNFTASFVDYVDTRQGDGVLLDAAAGLETALSSTITARATIGATFAEQKNADGTRDKNFTPSFSASACHREEKSNTCISAVRAVQPTTSGGLRNITGFDALRSWKLTGNDELSVRARYSRNDESGFREEGASSNEVAGVSGSYRRKLADHLFIAVSPGFERRFGEGGREGTNNFSVNVALTYRLGSTDG